MKMQNKPGAFKRGRLLLTAGLCDLHAFVIVDLSRRAKDQNLTFQAGLAVEESELLLLKTTARDVNT